VEMFRNSTENNRTIRRKDRPVSPTRHLEKKKMGTAKWRGGKSKVGSDLKTGPSH